MYVGSVGPTSMFMFALTCFANTTTDAYHVCIGMCIARNKSLLVVQHISIGRPIHILVPTDVTRICWSFTEDRINHI